VEVKAHPRAVDAIVVVALLAVAGWFAATADATLGDELFYVLLGVTVLAALLVTRVDDALVISATFTSSMLAVAFLGPAAAVAIVVVAELVEWAVERYRAVALGTTILAAALPNLVAGTLFPDVARGGGAFPFVLTGIAVACLTVNFVLVRGLLAVRDGKKLSLRPPKELLPALALNIVMTVALAELYVQSGLPAMSFAALVVVAFSYMARLVFQARDRAKAYAALSWGVLSGLLRTLDERDPRAARHGAAVARFSRDVAAQRGLSDQDQELAHTAGLLHDIGRFALSDRVMERGTTLTDPDWKTIRRHPTIGADLLRDVGLYGPVAEIVRAHHERWDGRGYPDGLEGEEIPEIARIVAVAEVYDTLTAPDTYRTPLTSFEALNELRRVAGKQLDADVVESLASVLAGRGTDYRHADAADYDAELDLLRRVDDAARG
jgi:putative nucleotidyltransferase with HDIG domain